MAKMLYVEPNDEITDLVDRIRRADEERDLVFVVPPEGRVLRSPLDMQLLMQYARGFQKRTAIVSADPQVQSLAMRVGFPTFSSLARLEQGAPLAGAPAAAATLPVTTGIATATIPEPREVVAHNGSTALAPPPPRVAPATRSAPASGGGGGRWWATRRARNIGLIAGGTIFLLGLLSVLFILPTATVTVSVQAHRINDSVTLQGSQGASAGNTLDQFSAVPLQTPTAQAQFQVSPSGTKVVPAVQATGTIDMCTNGPGAVFTFGPSQPEFQATQGVDFTTTASGQQSAYNCKAVAAGTEPALAVPVTADSALTVGSKGNVAASQTWTWTNQSGSAQVQPSGASFVLSNPAAMTGGQDAYTQTIFTSSDVASAQAQQQRDAAQLTTKVEKELKAAAKGMVIAQDSSGNGIQLTTNNPTLPTAGQVGSPQTLTVSVSAAATAYSPKAAKAAELADLKSKVPHDGELLANPQIGTPHVVAAGPGGNITLSGSAVGYWAPKLNLAPYAGKLTFMSPSAAKNFLLSRVPGSARVQIKQSPFGLPWLPLLSSRLHLVRVSTLSRTGAG